MRQKTLVFYFRGEEYRVNSQGHIKANGLPEHSPGWVFLGGSRHHWRNGVDVDLHTAFENPSLLNGCLGWDVDHGTTRRWGGQYFGRIPRIQNAHVEVAS
jgi:hypothetical protein